MVDCALARGNPRRSWLQEGQRPGSLRRLVQRAGAGPQDRGARPRWRWTRAKREVLRPEHGYSVRSLSAVRGVDQNLWGQASRLACWKIWAKPPERRLRLDDESPFYADEAELRRDRVRRGIGRRSTGSRSTDRPDHQRTTWQDRTASAGSTTSRTASSGSSRARSTSARPASCSTRRTLPWRP